VVISTGGRANGKALTVPTLELDCSPTLPGANRHSLERFNPAPMYHARFHTTTSSRGHRPIAAVMSGLSRSTHWASPDGSIERDLAEFGNGGFGQESGDEDSDSAEMSGDQAGYSSNIPYDTFLDTKKRVVAGAPEKSETQRSTWEMGVSAKSTTLISTMAYHTHAIQSPDTPKANSLHTSPFQPFTFPS
jgi:hypothetical protein